jgi:hypothetical protein
LIGRQLVQGLSPGPCVFPDLGHRLFGRDARIVAVEPSLQFG